MSAAPRKKQAIIEKAVELVKVQGVSGLTMEAIAEAVPVSKATIYNHFVDRDALMKAVIRHILESELNRIKDKLYGEGGTVGALRSILSGEELARSTTLYSKVFLEDLTMNQPELLTDILEYTQVSILPFFERIIFEGQRDGLLRKDVSPHLITILLMAIKSYCARPEVLKEILDAQSMQEQLLSLFMKGVLAEDAR